MIKLSWMSPLLALAALAAPACGGKVTVEGPIGTSTTGSGGATCSTAAPCAQGSYCDYADDLCGKGDPTGKCTPAPMSDCGVPPMACGCDGVVGPSCYGSVGMANVVDLAPSDTCPTPPGDFPCGSFFCPLGQGVYCQGRMDLTTCGEDLACVSLPDACSATPTCDCLTSALGLMSCAGDASSGITGVLPGSDSPNCP